jgi:hypothetical protein
MLNNHLLTGKYVGREKIRENQQGIERTKKIKQGKCTCLRCLEFLKEETMFILHLKRKQTFTA